MVIIIYNIWIWYMVSLLQDETYCNRIGAIRTLKWTKNKKLIQSIHSPEWVLVCNALIPLVWSHCCSNTECRSIATPNNVKIRVYSKFTFFMSLLKRYFFSIIAATISHSPRLYVVMEMVTHCTCWWMDGECLHQPDYYFNSNFLLQTNVNEMNELK